MRTRSYTVMVWLANHPGSTAYEIAQGIPGADPLRVLDILFEAEAENFATCQRETGGLAFIWWVKIDPSPVRVSGKAPGDPAGRPSSGSDTNEHG